ncbi:hypothetical protein [Pseudomonas sp. 24 R 17]|nr:hypothetical protein [Pseudomonas sp. 24 R 17]
MVQRHQQLVIFIVQAHQGHPQQRAFFQVELGARFVFANLLRAGFTLGHGQVAEVDELELEIRLGIDALEGLAVAFVEAGAQGFVALDQVLEAQAHGVFIQLAAQAQGAGDGVGAAVWVQLPGDPQAVLRQGLGQVFLA